MLKKIFYNRKLMISLFVVLIVIATLVAVGPVLYSAFMGKGVKTEGINADKISPATTEIDGNWQVIQGNAYNYTSAGFTFYEILPAEETVTSGSTGAVTGQATVEDETLQSGRVVVDMQELSTDKQVRDQNMKTKLFETDEYPEATFEITKPAKLDAVPDNGDIAQVELDGELTIKDKSKKVTATFDIVRDEDTIILAGDIPINRVDFDVNTPDLIAAKIAEEGEVNIRITFGKD